MAEKADDNTVFVGKKPTVAYVLAVATQASQNTKVKIKARGKSISKAVDISQIAVNRQLQGWKVSNISIGTEERPYTPREGEDPKAHEGETQHVSFIEIEISKA